MKRNLYKQASPERELVIRLPPPETVRKKDSEKQRKTQAKRMGKWRKGKETERERENSSEKQMKTEAKRMGTQGKGKETERARENTSEKQRKMQAKRIEK